MGHYVIGISGASGAVYAQRTLEGALAASQRVTCVISETARRVMKLELGLHLTGSVEIDEGLLRVLSPSIGVSYRLQHNDDGDWTLAVPGYFWEAESNVA